MADKLTTTLSERPALPGERRARATMRDVAALAGVSIKTVSRVVNAEPGVSADLVRRVELAAERLGYHPDAAASSLRRAARTSETLGLMIEDVANPFSGAIHRGIEDAAAERGMAVLATSLDEDASRERDVVRTMIQRRVDGLVIMPAGTDHSYLQREIQAGLATVFVDRPPRFLDADTVLGTNLDGARDAVEHLISVGHRRIAFLGDLPAIPTAADREQGFREAMGRAGIAVDERLVRAGVHGRAAAHAAAAELLRLPEDGVPTAIFASQNLLTIGVIHALHREALQHLVALVGFDDVELADVLDPGVTMVAQDPYAMGRAAADLVFARLDGDRGPSRHVTIPTTLIVRGSGEIRPSEPRSGASVTAATP